MSYIIHVIARLLEASYHPLAPVQDRDEWRAVAAAAREEHDRLAIEASKRARVLRETEARLEQVVKETWTLDTTKNKAEADLRTAQALIDGLRTTLDHRTAALDAMYGVPCEQIRHEQELADLRTERDRLVATLARMREGISPRGILIPDDHELEGIDAAADDADTRTLRRGELSGLVVLSTGRVRTLTREIRRLRAVLASTPTTANDGDQNAL